MAKSLSSLVVVKLFVINGNRRKGKMILVFFFRINAPIDELAKVNTFRLLHFDFLAYGRKLKPQ